MLVYRDGFENEICCKGDQGNYIPGQTRLFVPFLDAVKQYLTTVYLFIFILYFVVGYYALALHCKFLFWGF